MWVLHLDIRRDHVSTVFFRLDMDILCHVTIKWLT